MSIKSGQGHKQLFPGDMLFTLDDLAEDLGEHLSRWLNRAHVLSPIFNLYFGTIFGSEMYGEHRFLSLAQAAESYHRRTSKSTILARPAFRQVRKKLCATLKAEDLPEGPAAMLESKISFLNEVPLRQRLKELLESQRDLAGFLIPDLDGFIASVFDTRNYLTHFDPRLREKAAQGIPLYRITEQLRFVIELVLLAELGITQEKQTAIVHRHQRYLREMRFLRQGTGGAVAPG